MQSVDNRVKHAAAGIAPSRRVQRYGKLAVAPSIQTFERLDELEKLGAVIQPCRDEFL